MLARKRSVMSMISAVIFSSGINGSIPSNKYIMVSIQFYFEQKSLPLVRIHEISWVRCGARKKETKKKFD